MFDLINFLCENFCGSTSEETFEFFSIHLRLLLKEILSETFSITLKSRRTRLIIDDFLTVVRRRNLSFFFFSSKENLFKRSSIVVVPREILLHVEWLAIDGEQKIFPVKSLRFDRSILRFQREIFFSFLQSKSFDENLRQIFVDDQLAADICLSSLTEWFQMEIFDCLLHNVRREKRRQLRRILTLINIFLLKNSKRKTFNFSVYLSMFITCLFYPFDDNDDEIQWEIRLIAAQSCATIFQREHFLLHDVVFLRIVARFIRKIRNSQTPSSILYAILFFFEQFGKNAVKHFLLPHLNFVQPTNFFRSNSILKIVERFSTMFDDEFRLKL